MPAPCSASFTSSSLNGLMIAVTRCVIRCPLSARHGFVLRLGRRQSARAARSDRCRVRHAVAELDVIGGRAVLGDVEAFELAVPVDAEVPCTGDHPYHLEDDEG